MDESVFKKMHIKPLTSAIVLYPTQEFSSFVTQQTTLDLSERSEYSIVLLFVGSRDEYKKRIVQAKRLIAKEGLIWICYPKKSKDLQPDINRDSLFLLAQEDDLQLTTNIALNDGWSMLRAKSMRYLKNEK